jgi:SIT4-associating protein SAP185/190
MPSLLAFLDPKHSWATQTSAGDFMKAIITVSANASQNEQTCIGPNELTRQLVSKPLVDQLIGYMLGGGNALTVGVGIVIEVIRKNNSDYDPDVGTEANSIPSSRDPIYLGTLLRMFAENVPNFMTLIMDTPAQKARLESTFGDKIEPLGFDRFKTCELMAELLHCSNMGLLNEVGSEELIAARDAQRRRLRLEGKLTATRGEEAIASADDLTMRMAHSSPADEGRKLGVTNADDDGFEEVTHAPELGEDTSHEFVKAEDEISDALPAASLLDKDEDDFVDEPLSSPRLNVRDDKLDEPQFEEPDLVVAPLSPSKKKPPTVESAPPTSADETKEAVEHLSLNEKADDKEGDADTSDEPEHVEAEDAKAEDVEAPIFFAPTISIPDSQVTTDDTVTNKPAVTKELSPHPEDTPAPLFSTKESTPAGKASAEASVENAEPKSPVKEIADEGTTNEAEPGEASIIVGHQPEQPLPQDVDVKPVVGDFLKMQFVEHRVVPTILSFFFSYPWNNFLHNVVYDIVQQVFNGPMDRGYNPTLAISLFEAADVTTQIINGQLASEQSQAKSKTRMGYMGHLTLIAEEVVKFTERHPPELLSELVLDKVMSQEWGNYVEGALAETRERDNAILGGVRPDVAMSTRQQVGGQGLAAAGLAGLGSSLGLGGSQGSSALADAGLNGVLELQGNTGDSSAVGANPFSISAGISSGFHSSSDEDDDDDGDNDEDVNNEVSLAACSSCPRSHAQGGVSDRLTNADVITSFVHTRIP